jgi:Fe-S cluster biogenesis protein NfuA
MSEEEKKPDGSDTIRITAEPTPNPSSFKFTVDRDIVLNASVYFSDKESAKDSPLADKLFALGKVTAVFISGRFVTVTKEGWDDWRPLAKQIGGIIRIHLLSGEPSISEKALEASPKNDEVEGVIQEVLAEIRPFVLQDGGDIIFDSFENGIVKVRMQGSCSGCPSSTATLRHGIESKLKARIPTVQMVVPI